MLSFSRIEIGSRKYDLVELSGRGVIEISTVAEAMNEHRITAFLKKTLSDADLPYEMTAQERYYLLIQYLAAQKNTLLGTTTSFASYVLPNNQTWQSSVRVGSMVVQQLTGRHVELLEELCESASDWVNGSMALQIVESDIKGLPLLPVTTEKNALSQALKDRVNFLVDLPISQFNDYFTQYQQANDKMATLVRLGFDAHGLTVLGGTDDAPMRFRPAAAITGVWGVLERYSSEHHPKPNN